MIFFKDANRRFVAFLRLKPALDDGDQFKLIFGALASVFKSREKLKAEILILGQQINVLRRRAPKRPNLNHTDFSRLNIDLRRMSEGFGAMAQRIAEPRSNRPAYRSKDCAGIRQPVPHPGYSTSVSA